MKTEIKLIAFDLFGVLISEGHMVSNALMPLLPADTEKKSVKAAYHDYTNGEISEPQFWERIGQDGYHGLRDAFLDTFVLDDELKLVKEKLKSRYRLAVLSNLASDWGAYLAGKFGFADDFSPLIISGEVRCSKPDPAIYQHLIKASHLAAAEIAFIDDRLENLATAHQLGMTTIHYQREADLHAFQPDHVIRRLQQLLPVFS